MAFYRCHNKLALVFKRFLHFVYTLSLKVFGAFKEFQSLLN